MVAIGVAAQTLIQLQTQLEKRITEGFVSKSMELKWVSRRIRKSSQIERRKKQQLLLKPLFPIYISTDPRHVDPHRLRDLFSDCNHSCHRFPNDAVVEPVDIHKLRIALSHSAVLVSVFCKPHHVTALADDDDGGDDGDDVTSAVNMSSSFMGMADFLQSVTPVSPSDGELVGFGRAVSDSGLTASIYDVT